MNPSQPATPAGDRPAAARSVTAKTIVFAAIVVLSNVTGNALLAAGMKRLGEPVTALDHVQAVLNPAVAGGIVLLVVWMLSKMALLSWADLSYVLPVTAFGYALNAVAGMVLFGEQVSATRWMGVAAIVAGVLMVSRTEPSTTPPPAAIAREDHAQKDVRQ